MIFHIISVCLYFFALCNPVAFAVLAAAISMGRHTPWLVTTYRNRHAPTHEQSTAASTRGICQLA